jgi:DNA invertase Pin-like site-specific DNA recombinase
VLSFVAENERTNIKQRQAEGITAAKARGVRFGRPTLPIPDNFYQMREDWRTGKIAIEEAAKACNMCSKTFYSKVYDPLTDTWSTGYWVADDKGNYYPVW